MDGNSGDLEELASMIYENYSILELLGKGTYGIVWKVQDVLTGEVLALKKIFGAFNNALDAQRTYREVFLLRCLKNEKIIGLRKVMKGEDDELYLIFDFMDSDLHQAIRLGILEEDHKRYLIYQLLQGLKFIHTAGVIHRDMKPENILVDTNCELKIADLGLARTVDEKLTDAVMTDYVASRWYRAPEILFGSHTYTTAVDMWGVGCIVAELYGERALFPGKSTIDQITRVLEITGKPSKEELDDATQDAKYVSIMLSSIPRVITRSLASVYPQCDDYAIDFMERCLIFNPQKRMTVQEALEHPYVSDYREIEEEIESKMIIIPLNDNIQRDADVYKAALEILVQNWNMDDQIFFTTFKSSARNIDSARNLKQEKPKSVKKQSPVKNPPEENDSENRNAPTEKNPPEEKSKSVKKQSPVKNPPEENDSENKNASNDTDVEKTDETKQTAIEEIPDDGGIKLRKSEGDKTRRKKKHRSRQSTSSIFHDRDLNDDPDFKYKTSRGEKKKHKQESSELKKSRRKSDSKKYRKSVESHTTLERTNLDDLIEADITSRKHSKKHDDVQLIKKSKRRSAKTNRHTVDGSEVLSAKKRSSVLFTASTKKTQ